MSESRPTTAEERAEWRDAANRYYIDPGRTLGRQLVEGVMRLLADLERAAAEQRESQAWIDNAVAACAKRQCSLRDQRLKDAEADLARAESERDDELRRRTALGADLARARERIGELAGEKAATESSGWKAGMEQGRIDGLMTALGIANAYDYDPVGRSIAEILRPLVREGANRDG